MDGKSNNPVFYGAAAGCQALLFRFYYQNYIVRSIEIADLIFSMVKCFWLYMV